MVTPRALPPLVRNPDAVVFDLDGTLVDTEPQWAAARFEIAREVGGELTEEHFHRFYGANTAQWGAAMAEILGHPDPDEVARRTIERLLQKYREGLAQIPAAIDAVRRAAARGPVAIASGSPHIAIETILRTLGIEGLVQAAVSCDEVAGGKPLPDVYLEACRRLGVDPARTLAVEDSLAGARSAKAAGMTVVLVPMPGALSSEGAAEVADVVLDSLASLRFDPPPGD